MWGSARAWVALIATAGAIAACGGDDATGEGGSGTDAGAGARAVFAPPADGPLDFRDVPFPSDLYLGEDGTADIASVAGETEAIEHARSMLAEREGFCRTCSIVFPIEGALDPATVPGDTATHTDASLDDAIFLVRADGTGEPIPLRVDYDHIESRVVVQAAVGEVLEPQTQYAAVLTSDIRAEDGTPLQPWPVFTAIRDGEEGDAAVERARPVVAPVLDALESAGVERERMVSAAVFTTDESSWHLRAVRRVIEAAPTPVVTVDRVLRSEDGDLDELLGNPAGDYRPGIDVEPADGVGDSAVFHDAMDLVVLGTFESPRVVEGAGTDIGGVRRDAGGEIAPGPDAEEVPFLLVVPKDPTDIGSMPVVLAHHGMPQGSRRFALSIGNTFARLGMAVLSFDAFQMGDRGFDAKDEGNAQRGTDVPDGLADRAGVNTILRLIGISGAEEGHEGDPKYSFGANTQHMVDAGVAVRLLREGDTSAIAAADPTLSGFAFDPDQVHYVGQSYGGYVGMAFLPTAEGVQSATLMVGVPDGVDFMTSAPGTRSQTELLLPVFGVRGEWEESGRRLTMSPKLNLIRWALEPFSPANTLRHLIDEPLVDAQPPDVLWIHAECDELGGTLSGEHVLGIAGVPVRGPLHLTNLPELSGEAHANHDTPHGAITAAGWVYEGTHGLFVLGHKEVVWEKPYVPPFERLPEPRDFANPIEAAHEQVGEFVRTRMTEGRGRIVDPFAD